MHRKPKKIGAKTKIFFHLVLAMVLFLGCASPHKAEEGLSGSKRITNMTVGERSGSFVLTIDGNRPLTYSAEKLVVPMGVVLQFPDTSLELSRRIFIPPENEIISSVKAVEHIENQTTTARIFISFKKDTSYDLSADAGRLTVTFPAAGGPSKDAQPEPRFVEKKLEPEPEPEKQPRAEPAEYRRSTANYLKTVTAKTLEDKTLVEVKADDPINDYKSFTLDRPPRIVFDLYNLKSPYSAEQTVAVGSPEIKSIRHFAHPDKVRLVLETRKRYLSRYSAIPVDTGLLIDVGDTRAAPDNANRAASAPAAGTGRAELAWEPVPGAEAYNIYWSTSPGVTRRNGNKIPNVQIPAVIKDLRPGVTYYFVVTAVKGSTESSESEEFTFTPGD
jgi:type IV pilus assembly protein PilQ